MKDLSEPTVFSFIFNVVLYNPILEHVMLANKIVFYSRFATDWLTLPYHTTASHRRFSGAASEFKSENNYLEHPEKYSFYLSR